MIPGVAGQGGVLCLLHPQQIGWLAKQTDGSISGEMQDFKYDRMMRSNAFMATDVRTTGLKSLRLVIFEDFVDLDSTTKNVSVKVETRPTPFG